MMLRPRWVLALLLALAIAATFAVLGHWQLERAIESGVVVERSTETVLPLTRIAEPGKPLTLTASGQRVTLSGSYLPGDEQVISERLNGGTSGFWLLSRFETEGGANIAIARGWSEDEDTLREVSARLAADADTAPVTIVGRFVPGDAPALPDEDGDSHVQTTVSPAALINLWTGYTDQPVYAGYVVDTLAPAGLTVIDSPIPEVDAAVNWLNIFYALEWAVFAGFAVFLWYRLVRDAWEKELEDRSALRNDSGRIDL